MKSWGLFEELSGGGVRCDGALRNARDISDSIDDDATDRYPFDVSRQVQLPLQLQLL